MSENFALEGASITWLNLGGREQAYNAAGNRNFKLCLEVDDPFAQELIDKGYSVTIRQPNDEDGKPEYQVKVNLRTRYDWQVPTIEMFDDISKTKQTIPVELWGAYDDMEKWADYDPATRRINNVDLTIQGYEAMGNMTFRLVNLRAFKKHFTVDEKYEGFRDVTSELPSIPSVGIDDEEVPF
jgi:hypothetical protein